MNWYIKYNIDNIIVYKNNVFRLHRGKEISHKHYVITFIDGNELDVFVPHYFEELGTERRFISAIENYKLKQRIKKINKIKCIKKK